MSSRDRLRIAQEALGRRLWSDAFRELAAADSEEALDPDGLEQLASAAFWAGKVDDCLQAWERAYAGHLERSDRRRAAAAAIQIAMRHAQRSNRSLAQGWRATAARLLADLPDSAERGRLLNQEAYGLIVTGNLDAARAKATEAYGIGERSGGRSVQVIALNLQGQVAVRSGDVERGLHLIDESCAQTRAGQLDDYDAGVLYCWTIGLCRDLADFERARELTEYTAAWCEQNSLSSFPGICRIHRAELFRLHGELESAATEAQAALDELLPRTLFWSARGFNELGLIRLRQGRLDEADAAFDHAQELGMEPEPGRSLVQLARGRPEVAITATTRALERRPQDLLDRAAILAALVEASIATRELTTATTAVEELEGIAGKVGSSAFQASAAAARGALLVAQGKPGAAIESLRTALQLWIRIQAPYEIARTRLLIAGANAAEGDHASARLEAELANAALEKMGAALRVKTMDPLEPLTRRQREVARLVADGLGNKEIAGRLHISERTAEYHVQQILNALGFDSRVQIASWYSQRR